MDLNKRISEFIAVTETDNTSQIPVVQGLPLQNCKITPRNFASSIALILLARPEFDLTKYILKTSLNNVDNTADLDKPVSFATQTELNKKVNNSRVLTDVPLNAKFTDTIVDISGLATKLYLADRVKTAVPANAKFTDTVYTAGENITIVGNKISSKGGTANLEGVELLANRQNSLTPNSTTKYPTVAAVNAGLSSKVDKEVGKSLLEDSEIARLLTLSNQEVPTGVQEHMDNTDIHTTPTEKAT